MNLESGYPGQIGEIHGCEVFIWSMFPVERFVCWLRVQQWPRGFFGPIGIVHADLLGLREVSAAVPSVVRPASEILSRQHREPTPEG